MEPGHRDAVLVDPFCEDARELARAVPPLNALGQSYVSGCRDRLEWFASPSHEADGVQVISQRSPPDALADPPDMGFDVATFYLLMQACAAQFTPTSFEVRTLIASEQEITRRRIKAVYMRRGEPILNLFGNPNYSVVGSDEISRQDLYKIMALRKFASVRSRATSYSDMHEIRFKVRWTEMLATNFELTDLYIREGWAYLSANDFIDMAAQRIGVRIERYVSEVKQKMVDAGVEPHPFFRRIGKIVSELAEKSHQDLAAMGGQLREEFYPPCIKLAQQGVDAGSRNYAITVLLTSFLSHARISPFAGDAKISDFIDDISVITEDILPRIFEAGARCNPPLFDDQPVERANILYHLGLGLLQTPRLADSGNSTWYIPPNCEKVQREVPMLCNPDGLCRRIKNPIQYYVIKVRDADEAEGRGPTQAVEAGRPGRRS